MRPYCGPGGQLHRQLFGRRHSILQSHGLFGLSKLLYCFLSLTDTGTIYNRLLLIMCSSKVNWRNIAVGNWGGARAAVPDANDVFYILLMWQCCHVTRKHFCSHYNNDWLIEYAVLLPSAGNVTCNSSTISKTTEEKCNRFTEQKKQRQGRIVFTVIRADILDAAVMNTFLHQNVTDRKYTQAY